MVACGVFGWDEVRGGGGGSGGRERGEAGVVLVAMNRKSLFVRFLARAGQWFVIVSLLL